MSVGVGFLSALHHKPDDVVQGSRVTDYCSYCDDLRLIMIAIFRFLTFLSWKHAPRQEKRLALGDSTSSALADAPVAPSVAGALADSPAAPASAAKAAPASAANPSCTNAHNPFHECTAFCRGTAPLTLPLTDLRKYDDIAFWKAGIGLPAQHPPTGAQALQAWIDKRHPVKEGVPIALPFLPANELARAKTLVGLQRELVQHSEVRDFQNNAFDFLTHMCLSVVSVCALFLLDFKTDPKMGQGNRERSDTWFNSWPVTLCGVVIWLPGMLGPIYLDLVSDHHEHSACTLYLALLFAIDYVSKEYPEFWERVKGVHIWSDAGSHFRAKAFIGSVLSLFKYGLWSTYNTFQLKHGKKHCDRHFAIITKLLIAILKEVDMQNFRTALDCCRELNKHWKRLANNILYEAIAVDFSMTTPICRALSPRSCPFFELDFPALQSTYCMEVDVHGIVLNLGLFGGGTAPFGDWKFGYVVPEMLAKHRRIISSAALKKNVPHEYVAKLRQMERRRTNLEAIQDGRPGTTDAFPPPACDADVMAALVGANLLYTAGIGPTWYKVMASRVNQVAYMYEGSIGDWAFVTFGGQLTKQEAKVANKGDDPNCDAFVYSFPTSRGRRSLVLWETKAKGPSLKALLGIGATTKAAKEPQLFFLKKNSTVAATPEQNDPRVVSWVQCHGCRRWLSVSVLVSAIFHRSRFLCMAVAEKCAAVALPDDTDDTVPRALSCTGALAVVSIADG